MWDIDSKSGMVTCKWNELGNGYWLIRSGENVIDCRVLKWFDSKAIDSENKLEFQIIYDSDGIQFEIKNISDCDFRLDEILLRFDNASLQAEDYLEYIHSKWLYEAQSTVKRVGLKDDFVEANPESSMVYLLKPQDKNLGYLFAVLPPQQEDYVYFKALHRSTDLQGEFGLEIRSEQSRTLLPGTSIRCSKIMFDSNSSPMDLLNKLGDRYASMRPLPLKQRAVGWNSWDDLKRDVNFDNSQANCHLSKEALGDKVQYIVLDDGWEKSWGDWAFRSEFMSTGEEFCKSINDSGGIPGIWLAPLYAGEDLMEKHPEWFARMPDGSLVETCTNAGEKLGCLDITVPQVAEHLYNVYSGLKKSGFKYFKVDFTQMVQRCTGFHDPTVGRGAIIRKTFEVIRNAVGDDAYILACAPPYESVFGLVDAARTTADIQLKWSVVQFNIGSAACRWWMDRKLWNNDPDFLIVRSPEFCDIQQDWKTSPFVRGEYFSGNPFSVTEARSWALIAVLTGDVILGDDLRRLNESGMETLKRVMELAPINSSAIPIDLFSCGHNRLPRIWFLDEPDCKIIAVFNWDGELEHHCLALKDYGIKSNNNIIDWFSNEKIHPDKDMNLKFTLKPHDSICIYSGAINKNRSI